MPAATHSSKYRRPEPPSRTVSVKEALAVLRDASSDSKAQALVKNLTEVLEGSDAGQTDKATAEQRDTPGARSARDADPSSTDARD